VLRSEGCFGGGVICSLGGESLFRCRDGGRRRRNRGEEGRRRGDILRFTDGIINENISSVIASTILPVKGTHHCTKIPV